MKTIKVNFTLSIGYPTACHEDTMELEFDDDMTQKEIEEELEEYWKDWSNNYIDGGWSIEE